MVGGHKNAAEEKSGIGLKKLLQLFESLIEEHHERKTISPKPVQPKSLSLEYWTPIT